MALPEESSVIEAALPRYPPLPKIIGVNSFPSNSNGWIEFLDLTGACSGKIVDQKIMIKLISVNADSTTLATPKRNGELHMLSKLNFRTE